MASAWSFSESADSIARLDMDTPGRPVNVLDLDSLTELARILHDLKERKDLRGLIVGSSKAGRCIAGADLKQILGAGRADHARLIHQGQEAFAAFSDLSFPTVGLIDGVCLGGGLELFLALDDRLASDSPATRLGLPEVSLALMPAWGGTQRLPRLIGTAAVDLIVGCEAIGPRRAGFLGLIHEFGKADQLLERAKTRVTNLLESSEWEFRRQRARGPADLGPSTLDQSMKAMFTRICASGRKSSDAALRAIQAISQGAAVPLQTGLQIESALAIDVFGSPMAQECVSRFLSRNRPRENS
jgi:3-hydroxyacyl-CoA dehydrogenase / enoyl-CoA hydratase / 3-hydroxybutyryl-CoA epimerase / enoyl-CoA isomerase